MKTKTYLLFLLFGILSLSLHVQLHAQDNSTEQEFIYGGLAWSPDGNMIAVGTSGGIWLHSSDDLSVIRQLVEHPLISTLDWSPDGSRIASGERIRPDAKVQIWDAQTGEEIYSLQGHTHFTTSVAWSPDGLLLASGSWDDTIRIWNAETGEPQQIISLDSGITIDYTIDWSSDGEYIAFQQVGQFTIWDIATRAIYFSWPNNIETPSFAWSPEGEMIATASVDGLVNLWDASTGELLTTFDGAIGYVDALAWSPDSTRLVSHDSGINIARDGKLQVWDVTTGELIIELPNVIFCGNAFYTNAYAWSPDGRRLASTSDNGKVFIWDMKTYETLAESVR